MPIDLQWRGPVDDDALNALHAEAFDHDVLDDPWGAQLERHSLGWVTARDENHLVGFVNVAWDGGVHAFLVDTIVATAHRGRGIGTALVERAVEGARAAGCEWLHVDWDEDLDQFYVDACGFTPTPAGLHALR